MQHKKNMGKKFIRLSFCRVLYLSAIRFSPNNSLLFDQPIVHLNSNNLFSIYHSGFRESHSTATALVKILDEINRAAGLNEGVR
jgi:hypothetical protein